jgi:HK97 family phage major capsid protein
MVRQDVEIQVTNVAGTSFQNDQTWIRLISRYDVGVAHPEAFFAYSNG